MNHDQAIEILLVDDNPNDVELMLHALKKHNLANRFFVVEDGVEALDFLFRRGRFEPFAGTAPPRVVFLDLKLPKVSGLEVLREMKGDPRTHDIPVVVVTSSQEDPDLKASYALGVNSFVVKPVEFEAFVNAISQLGLYWLLINQPPW